MIYYTHAIYTKQKKKLFISIHGKIFLRQVTTLMKLVTVFNCTKSIRGLFMVIVIASNIFFCFAIWNGVKMFYRHINIFLFIWRKIQKRRKVKANCNSSLASTTITKGINEKRSKKLYNIFWVTVMVKLRGELLGRYVVRSK